MENNSLRKDLAKFVEGTSKLNILLQHKRLLFDKEGIGFTILEDKNKNFYNIPVKMYRRCSKGNYIEAVCKDILIEGVIACKICDSKNHVSENCSYKK